MRLRICSDPGLLAIDENADGPSEEIDENSLQEDDILIYPNPGSGLLQVRSSLENFDLQVFDSSGKLHVLAADNPQQVDLRALPSGLYLLKIRNRTTGQSYARRYILQH